MSTAKPPAPAQEYPPLPRFRGGDVDAMWQYLRPGLDLIMSESSVSNPYYMALYSCVYNYCTSSTRPTSADKTAYLVGGELYIHLETYFAAHVATMPPLSAEALAGDDALLKAYADVFAGFSKGAKYIDRICLFLNRSWVKREQDEGAEAYTVYSLALKIWQDDYLTTAQTPDHRLTSALVRIIDKARDDSGKSDPTLFKAIAASLVDVSSTSGTSKKSTRKPLPPKKLRTIYKTQLLEPLVTTTRAYYDKKADSYFEIHTVGEYVIQVEEWLRAEEMISNAFFDDNHRIVGIAEDVLIRSKFDVLETEADRLLELPPTDASKELVLVLTLVARLSTEPDVAQDVLVDWTDLATNAQVERSQDPTSLKQRTLIVLATSSPPVGKD